MMRDSRRVRPSASGCRPWPATMRSPGRSRRARKCCASIGCTRPLSAADFYDKNRFPAYCYDKLVLGLIDSHQLAGDADAFATPGPHHRRRTAAPAARMRSIASCAWRPGKDQSYRWDESYTIPENLFLAYRRGAGGRYRELGGALSRRRQLVRSPGRAARTCWPASMPTATSTRCPRRCRLT